MPEPAFLVEGRMEQQIIQRLCPDKAVRLINCNGRDVTMSAIAKVLDARLRRLKNFHPIIIILDRERRPQTCDELLGELTNLLDAKGYQGAYVLGMADRTIENWILSDWEFVSSEFEFLMHEGLEQDCHGKTEIRKLLPNGTLYHETTLGVDLFLKCRAAKLFDRSTSFRSLVTQLDFQCHWLREVHERFCPQYH